MKTLLCAMILAALCACGGGDPEPEQCNVLNNLDIHAAGLVNKVAQVTIDVATKQCDP
jgi:hypothetical protein